MTINELRSSVTSSRFRNLLPESTLRDVVEPLEAMLHVPGLLIIYDVDGDVHFGDGCANPAVTAPIIVDGQEIGGVALCKQPDDPAALSAPMYVAHVLSLMAMETARRRNMADEVLARYDELNLIYDLVALISSHNLSQEDIMRAVVQETNRILRAELGAIYVYDEVDAQLIPISSFGRRSSEQFWQGRTRELALSTLYAYDTTQLFEGGRMLCAPLRYDEERLGALVLIHEATGKTFSANDVNLMTTLAHNTALFIRAARLFDSLTQRNRELELTLAELQSTRDELSRAERLSIIGQIVGGLVHDMRNPLNIVMGYAGLMQEGGLTQDDVSEYATQIIAFVSTFSSMAQEILDYARDDERIERQPVAVDEYMDYIRNLVMPPGLRRPVKIEVDSSAARGCAISIDRQRFGRVFQNLVNNAVDAIEDGSGSRVLVQAEPTDDGMMRFRVSDDGPGVPPDVAETMFEPLTTTKSQGTGLGLAIVRRMVLKHGGDIYYEPAPNGGASFVFVIPQADT